MKPSAVERVRTLVTEAKRAIRQWEALEISSTELAQALGNVGVELRGMVSGDRRRTEQ